MFYREKIVDFRCLNKKELHWKFLSPLLWRMSPSYSFNLSLFARLFSAELLMDGLPLSGIKIPNGLSFHWDVIDKSLLQIQSSATYHFSMDILWFQAFMQQIVVKIRLENERVCMCVCVSA